MSERIIQAMTRLFERHRIVFWYDAAKDLRHDFEGLFLQGIEKIEIANNEFGIKYRILREKPEQKFLLYHEGPQPADMDNWLLDVFLAQGDFRTDQVGLWLSELELGPEFSHLVQEHIEFFRAGQRRDALKKMLHAHDTASNIRMKMLAVCAATTFQMDALLEELLEELALAGNEGFGDHCFSGEKYRLIKRCGLDAFLWEKLGLEYGYESENPGVQDFIIQLFKDAYFSNFSEKTLLTGNALIFLKRWKDSRRFGHCFEILSKACSEILAIEKDLIPRDYRDLLDMDYFEEIDRKIIRELAKAMAEQRVLAVDVSQCVGQRRSSHWYSGYSHLYEAMDHGARFTALLAEMNFHGIAAMYEAEGWNLEAWVNQYARSWYFLDQLYRKFIFHCNMSRQASLMQDLSEQIENFYVNSYLFTLGNMFQSAVDKAEKWLSGSIARQDEFFRIHIRPILDKDKKVCVIVSDAMRYEIGEEMLRRILREDRYHAEIRPMLSMLPSYTQLGMAALLPNKSLVISDSKGGSVDVDGLSSQGTAGRNRILASSGIRAKALKSEEFMSMNKEDSRALIKEHQVLYLYHNRIDMTGDKLESEGRVFEAVEETLNDLILLIKKLTNANVNNLFITSDHGFIYQNRSIEESDYIAEPWSGIKASDEPDKEAGQFINRRFVIGKNLPEHASFKKFTPEQLGLDGNLEVMIPKSINRLRVRGSGSRFVHGGASLQEVVIPLIKINKKRESNVSMVDVEILRGAGSMITAAQLGVTLYQMEAVKGKILPRTLRAGIYTEDGELISDTHDLIFDRVSENPRDREVRLRFVLSNRISEFNNCNVYLRLSEKHGQTSHFKEYKSIHYLVRIAFKGDFDF
ncbi:BREX-1 system phosphatase PglZ type A [Desulfobotulus mexicanus]|uniref:BREX-1 system phosphatase PglZ type A n=1 Tax=Desulfobotulus mexicanus TaxID=2586642 RepID=A0A5Q4VDB3_9BACT|nr:BREX-1 system phosphatase PglZ type A [Desulfobotulus mexicanus]TYT75595.1 BREX-1 system phosphatase PglZ type A [Desulfobotulus mexicanus]